MSYASVLAENAPPAEQQPKPDQNLLEGQGNHHPTGAHHSERRSGEHDAEHDHDSSHNNHSSGKKEEQLKQKAKNGAREGKKQLEDPKNQAGAISLINVITLSATALVALKYWNQPQWDKRVVSAVIVGVSAILGGQGYLVRLLSTPQNK